MLFVRWNFCDVLCKWIIENCERGQRAEERGRVIGVPFVIPFMGTINPDLP